MNNREEAIRYYREVERLFSELGEDRDGFEDFLKAIMILASTEDSIRDRELLPRDAEKALSNISIVKDAMETIFMVGILGGLIFPKMKEMSMEDRNAFMARLTSETEYPLIMSKVARYILDDNLEPDEMFYSDESLDVMIGDILRNSDDYSVLEELMDKILPKDDLEDDEERTLEIIDDLEPTDDIVLASKRIISRSVKLTERSKEVANFNAEMLRLADKTELTLVTGDRKFLRTITTIASIEDKIESGELNPDNKEEVLRHLQSIREAFEIIGATGLVGGSVYDKLKTMTLDERREFLSNSTKYPTILKKVIGFIYDEDLEEGELFYTDENLDAIREELEANSDNYEVLESFVESLGIRFDESLEDSEAKLESALGTLTADSDIVKASGKIIESSKALSQVAREKLKGLIRSKLLLEKRLRKALPDDENIEETVQELNNINRTIGKKFGAVDRDVLREEMNSITNELYEEFPALKPGPSRKQGIEDTFIVDDMTGDVINISHMTMDQRIVTLYTATDEYDFIRDPYVQKQIAQVLKKYEKKSEDKKDKIIKKTVDEIRTSKANVILAGKKSRRQSETEGREASTEKISNEEIDFMMTQFEQREKEDGTIGLFDKQTKREVTSKRTISSFEIGLARKNYERNTHYGSNYATQMFDDTMAHAVEAFNDNGVDGLTEYLISQGSRTANLLNPDGTLKESVIPYFEIQTGSSSREPITPDTRRRSM